MKRPMSKGVALVLAAVVGSGLAGCEQNRLGAAAVVEDHRITVTEVQGYLDLVREQRAQFGLPTDLGPDAARLEVERRVLDLVFDKAASDLGLVVTPADAQATRDADERSAEEIANLAAQNNVTLASLDELFRRFTIERKISESIKAEFPAADDTQLQAVFSDRLVATAQSMDITINPRYGSFDSMSGQIQPTQFDFLRAPAGGKGEPAQTAE
ncbi:hypothetical protein [Sporichthya sp.]|uniref:hypothetical protein n=1 Tax=Sporichthya sp. TaxID=65475 RepID=UPI0017C31CB3|nr:hypothetical protein [Sporichthya sp.]MBA3745605.1 hypothetical protein [Sporichthya sp.]